MFLINVTIKAIFNPLDLIYRIKFKFIFLITKFKLKIRTNKNEHQQIPKTTAIPG